MGCIIVLKYPTAASPTATFEPVRGALLSGARMKFRSNAIIHETADPRIQYTYVKGGPFRERAYDFLCDIAEVESFYTFWAASLGQSFELLDPFTDPLYVLQRFPKDAAEPEPILDSSEGDALVWRLALTFRDALA